jgi:hypothetical protein
MLALQKVQTRKATGFGFRALAAAYLEVKMDQVREYIESKRARHARKLRLINLRIL